MPGSFSLPYPSSPATNDAPTSLPIRANFQALQSQINNADGAALQAKTVTEQALADAINPRLARTDANVNWVVSGGLLAGFSSLTPSLTAGVAYVGGVRVNSGGYTGAAVAINQDTYVDMDNNGNFTQTGVANNAAAPALAAGSIRLAKYVSNASAITSTLQIGSDSLSNLLLPPYNSEMAVLRNDNATNSEKPHSTILTGWGVLTPGVANSANTTITFGVTFTQRPIVVATFGGDANALSTYGSGTNFSKLFTGAKAVDITTTGFKVYVFTTDATNWAAGNTVFYQWMAIGEVV